MKNVSITLAAAAIVLSFSIGSVYAQQVVEPAVKILPTIEKGIVKIMYAYYTDQPVTVKFYNESGPLLTDRIKGETFLNGFSKKYDVRNLTSSYWIEVSTSSLSVTFKMVESNNGQNFTPFLEKTVYSNPLVAANN